MKCNARIRLNPAVKEAALEVAHQLMSEQSDAVAARCYNEMALAMLQGGLSPRTVGRIQDVLRFAVLPKLDTYYTPERNAKSNAQNIADADVFVETYLKEHGVIPMKPKAK